MKNITNYILENVGHKHVSLVFPDMSSLILYKFELEGQISDGKYENAHPYDHWHWINNVGTIKIGNTPGCYNGENSKLSSIGKWNPTNSRLTKDGIHKNTPEFEKLMAIANKLDIDTTGYKDKIILIPSKKYNIDDFIKEYNKHPENSWLFRIYGYGALGRILTNSDINLIVKNKWDIRPIIDSFVEKYKKHKLDIDEEYNEIQNNKRLSNNEKSKFTKDFLTKFSNELDKYTENDLQYDLKRMNFSVNTVIMQNYNN